MFLSCVIAAVMLLMKELNVIMANSKVMTV
jgi:hypothetical protein